MGGLLKPGVQWMTKFSAGGKFWTIALSLSALVQDQKRIKLGFGADAYVKEFAPSELAETIRRVRKAQ